MREVVVNTLGKIDWLRDVAAPPSDNDATFFRQSGMIIAVRRLFWLHAALLTLPRHLVMKLWMLPPNAPLRITYAP